MSISCVSVSISCDSVSLGVSVCQYHVFVSHLVCQSVNIMFCVSLPCISTDLSGGEASCCVEDVTMSGVSCSSSLCIYTHAARLYSTVQHCTEQHSTARANSYTKTRAIGVCYSNFRVSYGEFVHSLLIFSEINIRLTFKRDY